MRASVNKRISPQFDETALTPDEAPQARDMPIQTLKSQKSLEIIPDRMAKARAAKRNQPKKRKKGLDLRNHPKVLARLEQMPPMYRSSYSRAMSGKSPAAGIKAFCLMCVGWQREEVKVCTCPACPLYLYRPYKD